MTTDEYKSIAVDYDTWETLARWSENECRTVGGQIRFLVKTHSPLQKPETQVKPTPVRGSHNVKKATIGSVSEGGWTRKRHSHTRVAIKNTQRYSIMDLLFEYKEPLTNKEIHALAPESWKAVGINSLEAVQKITTAMYAYGFIKRRPSLIVGENFDKFQYQLTSSAQRLLKIRDKKREKAGWSSSD